MQRLRCAVWSAVLIACAGCGRADVPLESKPALTSAATPAATRAHPRLAPRAARALTAPRLPEDPVAGARSTEQWRERRASRLRMRQLQFDRDHMADHRVLLEQLGAVRARYDRARSEAALSAARAAAPAQLEKLAASIASKLDVGRGSRLLPDYEALRAALASSYPDAKLASLRGDASAFTAARASFDERLKAMQVWLEEAKTAKSEVAQVPDPSAVSSARTAM